MPQQLQTFTKPPGVATPGYFCVCPIREVAESTYDPDVRGGVESSLWASKRPWER
jgi:hypothetical protein